MSNEIRDNIIYKVDDSGMLIPDIEIDDCYIKPEEIDRFGDEWLRYTQENYPRLYSALFGAGELYKTALEVQEKAWNRLEELRAAYDKKHPRPTNPTDPFEITKWANERQAALDPIVFEEEVYVVAGINGDERFAQMLRMAGENV